MLYTRKGDDGTTGTFGRENKISKSSALAEALGTLDEINSLVGLCKVRASQEVAQILEGVQQTLFVAQAELAGAPKTVASERVEELERVIDAAERELPPITTFFVSGGTELAALLDYARTVARRAERRLVAVAAEQAVGPGTLAYCNRLSSLLYALARLENHHSGIKEEAPHYE